MGKFYWKSARNADPDQVGTFIRSLDPWAKIEDIDPAKVVDSARPVDSPIHDQFEWDDHAAAQAHRLDQAKGLLRSLRVVVEHREQVETECKVHVSRAATGTDGAARQMAAKLSVAPSSPSAPEPSTAPRKAPSLSIVPAIRSKEQVQSDRKKYDSAIDELTLFKKRYESVPELADVMKAISEAVYEWVRK